MKVPLKHILVKALYDFSFASNIHIIAEGIQTKVQFAKHLNPFTCLPGNILIQQKLQKLLLSQEEMTVLYLDLDNFKAYNDVYGFSSGDKVIMYVAQILNKLTQNRKGIEGSCSLIQ